MLARNCSLDIKRFRAVPGPRPGLGGTDGPDGNIWFTEPSQFTIGKITPAGVITEVTRTSAGAVPSKITTGPDGNLWFTEVGRETLWAGRCPSTRPPTPET